MEPATDFLYLGRKVEFNNSDWAALYQNLWKALRQWGFVTKVLKRTRVTVRAQEILYMAVVQTVWDKELGGDMRNDKRAGGLPPLGVQADCGEVGLVYGGQRVGMTPNGR